MAGLVECLVRRRPLYRGILLAAGVFDLTLLGGAAFQNHALKKAQQRGDDIVAMLESFRTENGAYPESFSQLVAAGKTIPKPQLHGTEFGYELVENTYRLKFSAAFYLTCVRYSASPWLCVD